MVPVDLISCSWHSQSISGLFKETPTNSQSVSGLFKDPTRTARRIKWFRERRIDWGEPMKTKLAKILQEVADKASFWSLCQFVVWPLCHFVNLFDKWLLKQTHDFSPGQKPNVPFLSYFRLCVWQKYRNWSTVDRSSFCPPKIGPAYVWKQFCSFCAFAPC